MTESSFQISLLSQNRRALLILATAILLAGLLELIFVFSIRFLMKAGFEGGGQPLNTSSYFLIILVPLFLVSIRAAVQWKVTRLLLSYVQDWYQAQRQYWMKIMTETS